MHTPHTHTNRHRSTENQRRGINRGFLKGQTTNEKTCTLLSNALHWLATQRCIIMKCETQTHSEDKHTDTIPLVSVATVWSKWQHIESKRSDWWLTDAEDCLFECLHRQKTPSIVNLLPPTPDNRKVKAKLFFCCFFLIKRLHELAGQMTYCCSNRPLHWELDFATIWMPDLLPLDKDIHFTSRNVPEKAVFTILFLQITLQYFVLH